MATKRTKRPRAGGTISRFKMTFPERIIGEPIIHRLSREITVVPNIVRGRITEKSAWLEIELLGTAPNIKRALKFLEGRGVLVELL